MTPGYGGVAALLRAWPEAIRLWGEGMLGARDLLTGLARLSGEEARATRDALNGASFPVVLARYGDFARAQWSLWAWAALAAGERAGRAALAGGLPGLPFFRPPRALSPRTLAFGAVTSDLYLGYAALRERERWFPGLVCQKDWELQHRRGAGRLLEAANSLGGTLIKAGQFASTRPDLLPAAYTGALSNLQDRVPPQPWAVIEEAIGRELGQPPSKAFAEFDRVPVAAASIAQVHRARLRNGRAVAVKVQYPGIAGLMEADLDALENVFEAIAHLEPDIRLKPIADYLRWTLPMELDFGREAAAIEGLGHALSDREDVLVPEVVGELTTDRLLVMEYAEGIKVTSRAALTGAGIDPSEVAGLLNDAYADQLFRRGILHADPHPGNLLVQPGPRLVLLDHGLTVSLDPAFTATLGDMVSAMGDGDLERLTGALQEAGVPVDRSGGLDALLQVVDILLGGRDDATGMGVESLGRNLGASVGDIPPALLLVGRAIGLLDGITRQLDPELDVLEVVARYTRSR